jgi:hypothetical protein
MQHTPAGGANPTASGMVTDMPVTTSPRQVLTITVSTTNPDGIAALKSYLDGLHAAVDSDENGFHDTVTVLRDSTDEAVDVRCTDAAAMQDWFEQHVA